MRILVVEDHADSRKAFQRLLKLRGFEVSAAGGLGEAMILAAAEAPELLLCDIRLRDGDGCDLLIELRKSLPNLLAVAITGWSAADQEARCRAAGFTWLLTKPVSLEEIEAVLADLIRSNGSIPLPSASATASMSL